MAKIAPHDFAAKSFSFIIIEKSIKSDQHITLDDQLCPYLCNVDNWVLGVFTLKRPDYWVFFMAPITLILWSVLPPSNCLEFPFLFFFLPYIFSRWHMYQILTGPRPYWYFLSFIFLYTRQAMGTIAIWIEIRVVLEVWKNHRHLPANFFGWQLYWIVPGSC